jgi:hypothetical protein
MWSSINAPVGILIAAYALIAVGSATAADGAVPQDQIPGYGLDDPPPGGALGLEVLRETRSGTNFVRAFYQAQTLEQLRSLTRLDSHQRPAMRLLAPPCAQGPHQLCGLESFRALLSGQHPTPQPSAK